MTDDDAKPILRTLRDALQEARPYVYNAECAGRADGQTWRQETAASILGRIDDAIAEADKVAVTMSRDWTHRQLVFAENRFRMAANKLNYATVKRDGTPGSDADTALRVAVAHRYALEACNELRRIMRRYEKGQA